MDISLFLHVKLTSFLIQPTPEPKTSHKKFQCKEFRKKVFYSAARVEQWESVYSQTDYLRNVLMLK